jgi:hypothetical protein
MIRNIILLCVTIFIFSCEKESSSNSLKITLDAVIQKSDSIAIYYTTDNSVAFHKESSYWIDVKGNKKNQTISFVFPDSIKPKQIRIDFGRNKKQPEIILNEIAFFYKKERFTAKGEEVYFLFRVDESNTVIDKLVGSLKRKEPNQATGPSLYPKGDKLYNKLCQLYNEK